MAGKFVPANLAESHRRVADGPPGRVVLLGGPGAGKTTALAERAVWLIGLFRTPDGLKDAAGVAVTTLRQAKGR